MAETNKIPNETKSNGAASANPWSKAIFEPLERLESVYEQMAKMQAASLDQARKNVDEAARLAKESIAYAEQLAAQWRVISFDAARRTAEMFSAKV